MAKNPIVTFHMKNGDEIQAELYPEIAPISVNNFISLINKKFYDGLIFHRVIKGFMIQGGCPEGTGMRRYRIQHQGRVFPERRGKQPEAHRGRAFHGKNHDSRFRRKPVLHHA